MSESAFSSDMASQERRPAKSEAAFRTISEVVEELGVPQHVLRFWETKFAQVRPLKRAGGRRYYRPDDVTLLKRIRDLLYQDGFTIKGVQKLLYAHGIQAVMAGAGGAQAVQLESDRGEERASIPLPARQALPRGSAAAGSVHESEVTGEEDPAPVATMTENEVPPIEEATEDTGGAQAQQPVVSANGASTPALRVIVAELEALQQELKAALGDAVCGTVHPEDDSP
ncbi:MAG: MerR family transcriptional regulator [Rhodospirillaceae bacterium]|nr:MAG: MerR family transcriptional regulator [Rhodospirillaceae bacterium]